MSIFYKADYNKKDSQDGDNSDNQENNNNLNTSNDSISRLANRFKTIITVLYYITVAIILLVTFVLIVNVADNRYIDDSVIFLIILGGIFALIINEVFWGMTATIIEIRDNTAKAILNKQNDKDVV
tara:strand:+ start:315 stop:692 length:378 start_codon:yes stop_codon:yes gene_type:complete